MTETENSFLIILRDVLHPGDEVTDLKTDWSIVFDIAKKQNLFPLVYDAATEYPSFASFEVSHPEYFAAATASMTAQMQKTDSFLILYKSFLSAGLSPITMKGIICRNLYGERADFRPSGDEDILVEKKDFERAVAVLESCGYRKDTDPDKNMAVVHEVTFRSEDLTVELHLNLFGTSSLIREKMNNWFRDVFRSEEMVDIKGVTVRTMTPTDHFLFLIFHAFKHFTTGGFGVRMMLDILLFAEKYGERIDWSYIDRGLNDVGALGFFADLVEIGNRYLGFKYTQRYNPVCPDELLSDMYRVGIFGNGSKAYLTARRIVEDTVQKGNNNKSRVRSYFRRLFPTWKSWCAWRPYLKDRPWMVVCEWCWRLGRYIRGETSISNMADLDKSYKIAEERMKLLEKYGVL